MGRIRFALEGISGLYNYGCEAIVRGTWTALRHRWPGCAVTYVSGRYRDDRIVLRDTDIIVVPATPHMPLVKRGLDAVMRRLRLPFRPRLPGTHHWLEGVDCVLSIGGDMYTLWQNEEAAMHFYRVEQAHRIMDMGKPVVLWGASVGPFEANPHAVEVFTTVLKRMPLITVRESISLNYLQQLGAGDRAALVADPAYLMTIDRPDAARKPTIAMNLSPLSVSYAYGQERFEEGLRAQVAIVTRLIKECDMSILLVPHVVCPWRPEDDDYIYLSEIKARVPATLQDQIELLPSNLGAMRTKEILSTCTVLIAARMHCAIAGLSMFVPTLLLSYSPKAIGMCEYAYGNAEWVLPVTSEPERVVSAVSLLLARGDELRDHLKRRMPAILEDALAGAQHLSQVLS